MTEKPKTAAASPSARNRLSTTGVVTFLDVLGWKGIYNREASPIATLSKLVKNLETASSRFRGLETPPKIHSISDTIVIYNTAVEAKDVTGVVDMHGAICGQAIAASIAAHIPVRGATALGEFEVQENNYVGKAIDEAASWYESGEWIGVHLTPSAMFAVDGNLKNWAEYQAPLKAGTKHNMPCVIWTKAWKKAVSGEDPRRQLQRAFRDMGPITPDFAMKFVNTLAYFDELVEREQDATKTEGMTLTP